MVIIIFKVELILDGPRQRARHRQVPHFRLRIGANYSRFLPIANISRIMKKALPDNAKIAKDAK
jgi:hypothetical protein